MPGYPKVECEMIQCPAPYMGLEVQPGAPPDPTVGIQDPFGTGKSLFCNNKCRYYVTIIKTITLCVDN